MCVHVSISISIYINILHQFLWHPSESYIIFSLSLTFSIIIICVLQTIGRKRPTFGGYSTKQEMCLSFITYYPKIDLAGCYSMTPVKEFFEIFGVYEFYAMNMTDVENLFLYNGYVWVKRALAYVFWKYITSIYNRT